MVAIVTDQKHSSDSSEIRALKKQLEEYHSQYNTLERKVKRLERDVRSVETELKVLDDLDCLSRGAVVDIIEETIPSLVREKCLIENIPPSSSSESSEESESVEIIEERDKKAVPHKQQKKLRSRKVKHLVV